MVTDGNGAGGAQIKGSMMWREKCLIYSGEPESNCRYVHVWPRLMTKELGEHVQASAGYTVQQITILNKIRLKTRNPFFNSTVLITI
jgi:hypothetical protein